MKYTILLLRPDYATDNFGQDTFQAHVDAANPAAAIELARANALKVDIDDENPEDEGSPEDYFVLAAYQGHLEDINPGE